MNEAIIISMVEPYVKDSAITYDEFENIFSILSLKEQYEVIEVLFKNGINLLDEQLDEEALILDTNDEEDDADVNADDDFDILYDDSIFKDKGETDNDSENLFVYKEIRQSNAILCSLIQQGNRQAVQDLCVKNKRLVDKYVMAYEKRYGNRLDFDDLEQVGFIGLIKAGQKFDIHQGAAFSTYAVNWIKQSISREIMDNGYVIRIPVHMMERINKVVAIDGRLTRENVPLDERITLIADEMGLTEDNIRECLTLKKNYLSYSSLDTPIGEEGDAELVEFIPDEEAESVEGIIMGKALRDELGEILKELKPKEREIVELRFGWEDGRVRTLEEIGSIYGVTRERIRQIEAKALKKLQSPKKIKRLHSFMED